MFFLFLGNEGGSSCLWNVEGCLRNVELFRLQFILCNYELFRVHVSLMECGCICLKKTTILSFSGGLIF